MPAEMNANVETITVHLDPLFHVNSNQLSEITNRPLTRKDGEKKKKKRRASTLALESTTPTPLAFPLSVPEIDLPHLHEAPRPRINATLLQDVRPGGAEVSSTYNFYHVFCKDDFRHHARPVDEKPIEYVSDRMALAQVKTIEFFLRHIVPTFKWQRLRTIVRAHRVGVVKAQAIVRGWLARRHASFLGIEAAWGSFEKEERQKAKAQLSKFNVSCSTYVSTTMKDVQAQLLRRYVVLNSSDTVKRAVLVKLYRTKWKQFLRRYRKWNQSRKRADLIRIGVELPVEEDEFVCSLEEPMFTFEANIESLIVLASKEDGKSTTTGGASIAGARSERKASVDIPHDRERGTTLMDLLTPADGKPRRYSVGAPPSGELRRFSALETPPPRKPVPEESQTWDESSQDVFLSFGPETESPSADDTPHKMNMNSPPKKPDKLEQQRRLSGFTRHKFEELFSFQRMSSCRSISKSEVCAEWGSLRERAPSFMRPTQCSKQKDREERRSAYGLLSKVSKRWT